MLVSAEEESACLAEEGEVVNYGEGCTSNAKMWRSESALIAQGVGLDCDLERMRTLSKLEGDC